MSAPAHARHEFSISLCSQHSTLPRSRMVRKLALLFKGIRSLAFTRAAPGTTTCLGTRSKFSPELEAKPVGKKPPDRTPFPGWLSRACRVAFRRPYWRRARRDRYAPPPGDRIPPHPCHNARHPPPSYHGSSQWHSLLGRILRQRTPRRGPHLCLQRSWTHMACGIHLSQRHHPPCAQYRSRSLGELSLDPDRRL